MKFDPALASPFRVDWLVPLDSVTQDDYTRAIAEKAEAILRSARFIASHQGATPTDMEVRVWIEAATSPACVSVTWEPGFHAFGFHLLDESLRERLGAIVFREFPCIDGDTSDQQADDILRAALSAIREAEERATPAELAERVRASEKTVRVPVVEPRSFDHGVEP
ncbi:MAG TPA: hypothetical protein VFH78_13055 [Candidatus Thermoplasmatota archaeon]|nr:hypothetical protein [Candidatus Thermoplasmatota archaeon]